MLPAVVRSQVGKNNCTRGLFRAGLLETGSMGQHKTKRKKLGDHWRFRLRHPHPALWGVGSSPTTVFGREGAPRGPPVSQGSRVRPVRAGRGLPGGHLPTGECLPCSSTNEERGTYFGCLRDLEARKTPLHHQPERTKPTLGQTVSPDGYHFIVWILSMPRRPPSLLRLVCRLSTLRSSLTDVGLVFISLRREILPVYSPTVRVDGFPILVCQTAESTNTLHAERAPTTRISMVGRLLDRTWGWQPTQYGTRLHHGIKDSRLPFRTLRSPETPWKGCLGFWFHSAGTPWSGHRYRGFPLFYRPLEIAKPPRDGQFAPAYSTTEKPMGPRKCTNELLRQCSITVGPPTSGSFLHQKPLRCSEERCSSQGTISRAHSEVVSRCIARPPLVVHNASGGWKAYLRGKAFLVSTYGRRRRRVRWDPWERHDSRFGGRDFCTRDLVALPETKINHLTRACGRKIDPGKYSGPISCFKGRFTPSASRRQYVCVLHNFEYGVGQQGANGGAPSPSPIANANEDQDPGVVAPICPQQARRQPEPVLEPSRSRGDSIIISFHSQITAITNRATVLASRRSTGGEAEGNRRAVFGEMGRRTQPSLEPSTSVDRGNTAENSGGERSRHHRCAQLDRSSLVRDTAAALAILTRRGAGGGAATLYLPARQPSLGVASRRGRDSATRSLQRRIASLVPETAAGRATVRLAEHCLAPATDSTKTSQWLKFVRYCESDGHQPLPAAEGTVLSYIGYLFEEDRIHGRSIDHYLSAIRTRHNREGLQSPFVNNHHVDLVRAFRHQDERRGALQDVRAAIPCDVIARIRHLGLGAQPYSLTEHQAAMVEFQYLLTWREGSVRTMQVTDVLVRFGGQTGEDAAHTNLLTLTARPRTLKGRLVRGVGACSLTCHHSPSRLHNRNPLALQLRFYRQRCASSEDSDLYWARTGLVLQPQAVSNALSACLQALQVIPPPFCTYTSHSLRSGSVTAQVLINVPLARTVARGAWRNSNMVVNVYFDTRVQVSTEMNLYFWSLTGSSNPTFPSPQ